MQEQTSPTWIRRLIERVFPRTPDFYRLLNNQCDLVVAGTAALVSYMESNDDTCVQRVFDIEAQGDKVKQHNMNTLHRAFTTPIDREDIYQAIAAIDDILNYAKTTVMEMQVLGLAPDEHTLAMAVLMQQGAEALQHGFVKLEKHPLAAEADALLALKTERSTEVVYRQALAELFDPEHYIKTLTDEQQEDTEALEVLIPATTAAQNKDMLSSVGFVLEILKRREIYRHMSNGADRIARASEVLHDIIAKVA